MHVLVFLTFGISLQDWEKSGSLERELLLYRNIHKKYNIRFTFVSFGDEEDELLSGEFNVIPYYKYNRQLKSRFRTLVQSIFFSLKIKSLVGETDLIKTNQLFGSWMAIIFKIKNKKPLFIRTGYDLYQFSKKEKKNIFIKIFYFILTQISILYANIYTVTSQSDINFIKENFYFSKNKILLVPNWVNQNPYEKLTNMNSRYENRILAVGRLEKQKNFHELIKLFSGSSLQIDIAGSGSQKKALREAADLYNVNVNFIGNLSHDELMNEYQKYRIYVSTSLYEGNPKSTLEAMGSGCLVIVSNITNNYEIVLNNEDGLLHEYHDLVSLVNNHIKNIEILETFFLRAYKKISNNNSLDFISQKEVNLYMSLLGKKIL